METANPQVHGSEFTVAPGTATPVEAQVSEVLATIESIVKETPGETPGETPKLAEATQLVAAPEIIVTPPPPEGPRRGLPIAESALSAVPAEATVTIAAPPVAADPMPTVTVPFTPPSQEKPAIRPDAPKQKAAPGSAPRMAPPIRYVPPDAARAA